MTAKTKRSEPSALARSLAARYTYRVAWSWKRLGYTVTCDEVPMWGNKPCISNVEHLLEASRALAARRVDRRIAYGDAVPWPIRSDGRLVTERSLREALRRSVEEIPFDGTGHEGHWWR